MIIMDLVTVHFNCRVKAGVQTKIGERKYHIMKKCLLSGVFPKAVI